MDEVSPIASRKVSVGRNNERPVPVASNVSKRDREYLDGSARVNTSARQNQQSDSPDTADQRAALSYHHAALRRDAGNGQRQWQEKAATGGERYSSSGC